MRSYHHGHRQTQEFSQSGFDLVDRITVDPSRRPQNLSMQEMGVHLNDDLDEEEQENSVLKCEKCHDFRSRLLE